MMKLSFLGAAHTVTGSCYLLETNEKKYLVDCGMFQGSKRIREMNYEDFTFNPAEIECMVLTHAHVDHSGMLPLLYARGFRGQIFMTDATADLCSIMLRDCAHIQMQEAEWKNRKNKRSDAEPVVPVYTIEDAENVLTYFVPCEYEKKIDEQLRDFIEECIEYISGDDKKRVRFYYEFHSFLIKEKPNMEQMKDYLEVRSEKMNGEILREKTKNEESKSAQNMQENLSDLIRDEKDSPEKDEIKIYEKTPKRILILIGKIISVVGCFCSILGIVYFVLKIFEYGFYYLFLIGSLVSIAGLGVSVYGCYKLWKKNKNPKTFVDSWQKTENAAELLDEKTILLEDEDDRTVLLLEEPIGRLVPKNPEQEEIVLNDNGFVIGSSAQGTDYQLERIGISRRHIRFYKEDGNVCCEDLDSTNGIKINGVKLNGKKNKKAVLKEGDCIKIGLEEFYFKQD